MSELISAESCYKTVFDNDLAATNLQSSDIAVNLLIGQKSKSKLKTSEKR